MTATIQTSGKTYSERQRKEALSLALSGLSSREVEARTGVGASRVRGLKLDFYKKEKSTVLPVLEVVAPIEQTETVAEKQAQTPIEQQKTPWRIRAFIFLAFLIVVGHAGLVWYDMALLWSVPGKIGGGVVFSFILAGMVLMAEKSDKMKDIKENMLWAVGLLESLAIVVHRGAFSRNAAEAYSAGFGVEYIWALAAVICLCSIGATVFYQKVIQ